MSMQDKILAALTKTVTEADPALEVIDQQRFANTGTLYVQPRDGFEVRLRIGYDFQHDYASLFLIPARVDDATRAAAPETLRFSPAGRMCGACCPQEALAEDAFWTSLTYAKSAEIPALLAFVAGLLTPQPVS